MWCNWSYHSMRGGQTFAVELQPWYWTCSVLMLFSILLHKVDQERKYSLYYIMWWSRETVLRCFFLFYYISLLLLCYLNVVFYFRWFVSIILPQLCLCIYLLCGDRGMVINIYLTVLVLWWRIHWRRVHWNGELYSVVYKFWVRVQLLIKYFSNYWNFFKYIDVLK